MKITCTVGIKQTWVIKKWGVNVGCIRCFELYICSDLDGIVRVKNAPSELIRSPNDLLASKRKNKNLFEASFVKLAVVDFFLLPTYSFLSLP